ncbi:hypothetical protein ANANG_G00297780 [Anguilla anguilla]|uniref:Homeobox B5a n=1 Tax=Anguilla anguilla TaxID=7936 RepID=A0A9D3RJX7_ANGAN|nr:hypothetical protein ANANG_G00297780 [Anguilla anguilla]
MSSYFVNSFSGRYPNGPDYQLLNYGTSSSAMNGSYRDSGTMHSGSYSYNYNGMDLSVNRPSTTGHFGAVGNNSRGFQAPARETRFRQPSSCSLASPESLPCSNSETLGPKSSSPPSDQSATTTSSSLTNTNSTHFTELDETSASSETEDGNLRVSNPAPRTQQQQQQESTATSTTTASTEGQAPQIFPWMRKLHISHAFRLWAMPRKRHKSIESAASRERETEEENKTGRNGEVCIPAKT